MLTRTDFNAIVTAADSTNYSLSKKNSTSMTTFGHKQPIESRMRLTTQMMASKSGYLQNKPDPY